MSLILSTGLVVTSVPNMSDITDEQKQHCNEWIKALESEDYKQGIGKLRTIDGKFCCLGVGCDVANKAAIGEWRFFPGEDGEDTYYFHTGENEQDRWDLTPTLQKYYGFHSSTPAGVIVDISFDKGINSFGLSAADFATLNDNNKATFKDIALILKTAIEGGLFNSVDSDVVIINN